MEEICPGYHTTDLRGYRRDSLVLEQLVQLFLPTMYAKLREAHVSVQCVATDHFISLASREWPLDSTVRLWDVIFMEGVAALFGSFVALLDLYMPNGPFDSDDAAVAKRANCCGYTGTAFNLMKSFKQESLCGVSNDFETVMALTRYYTEKIPDSLIAHLRENADENVSCTTSMLDHVCSFHELPDAMLAELSENAAENSCEVDDLATSMMNTVYNLYELPDELIVHPDKNPDASSSDGDFATGVMDSVFGAHESPDAEATSPTECPDFVEDFASSVLDSMFGPQESNNALQDNSSECADESASEEEDFATNVLGSVFNWALA
jgi:hypothetical protein